MSQLLLSELTALSSEAKRKSPDVRTASDNALSALRSNGEQLLQAKQDAAIAAKDNVLLQPIVLACEGKAAAPKVVGIAVGLLQRIIGLRIIRDEDCPMLIELLQHVVATRVDVEIQLKVLQAVSSLLGNYASIHHTLLSKTLHLCFQLQDSRIGVVSSTAAATLRQAVMAVFEKVRDEDNVLNSIKAGGEDAAAAAPLATMTVKLSSSSDQVTLFPCSRDAYLILADLNALANNEPAQFLELDSLSRTFALELIESILTNHAHLFTTEAHPELLLCLRQSTCPLLIRAFNDQPTFPTSLRLMRLLFVLLRQFSEELIVEVEILITILLRFIVPPNAAGSSDQKRTSSDRYSHEGMPPWQRVLAMEATRSLCSDGVLMRNLWKWFDGKENSVRVFTQLVDTLHKLSTENPDLIGQADPAFQMNQGSSSSDRPSNQRRRSSASTGLYNAAAGVASAAIGGLTSVTDLTTGGTASSVGLRQTSVPSVQLIDQLDKSDAPNVPSTYIYLLALQSLVNLAQTLSSFALPMYSRFVNSRPRSAPRAPPSLDLSTLSEQDRRETECARDMIQHCWAPILDSFTFFMSSKCDDVLFAEVLTALRNFTNTTGALGLASPRDALIASLSRFAIPRDILAKLYSIRNRPNASEEVDATLSERNAACLKAVTQIAYYLSGSLDTHWRDILETICDAEYILRRSGNRRKSTDADNGGGATPVSPADAYKPRQSLASISALSTIPPGFSSSAAIDATTGKPFALTQLDNTTLLADIARVFENTGFLSDAALLPFIAALCELDADHIGLVALTGAEATQTAGTASNSTSKPVASALNRSSPLSSLATVSMLNIKRIAESPDLERAWQLVTEHFLLVLGLSALRPALRSQAASALDAFIQAALRSVSEESITNVQRRSIDVLAKQSILDGKRQSTADVEVRKAGLETFLTVLDLHGHNLRLGWESMFTVFDAACALAQSGEDRSGVPLIKVAFSAMQSICSNLLGKLDHAQLKLCVETLTRFSMQTEEVNVALTASGALWGITAEVSSRSERSLHSNDDIVILWIHILNSVKRLTNDTRLQVRNGAISILFSILEQYGSNLSELVWRQSVMGNVLLPLLIGLHDKSASSSDEKKEWEESRVLALSNTGKVVRQAFTDKLLSATDVWAALLRCLKNDFVLGPSSVSQASIRALHHILQIPFSSEKKDDIMAAWQTAWEAWCDMGREMSSTTESTFTQANLLAYVETLTPMYVVLSAKLTDEQMSATLSCLKLAMTYAKGKSERIMDRDRLTPLQSAIIARITTFHLTSSVVAAQVLSDLAEYSTLAFIGGIESNSGQPGAATYVALNRTATEAMSSLYEQQASEVQIYDQGAVQQMFASLAIPLKLRYECPSSSSKDAVPLWKGSMIVLCKATSICSQSLNSLKISNTQTVQGVWTSMIGAYVSALQANCTPVLDMDVEEQNKEESFDLILLAAIERDIWPRLGQPIVPDSCTIQLSSALASTSRLTVFDADEIDDDFINDSQGKERPDHSARPMSFVSVRRVPREAFAYWCLDLLMLMCSASPQQEEVAFVRRTAAWSLPVLVERIQNTLSSYIRDTKVRGAEPLGRVRDEEINYILFKLARFNLWPDSLNVALSIQRAHVQDEQITELLEAYVHGQSRLPLESRSRLSKEVNGRRRDTVNFAPLTSSTTSSPFALLYHLYPLLCDFLLFVVPREGGRASGMSQSTCGCARLYERTPSTWLPPGSSLGQIGQPLPKDMSQPIVASPDSRGPSLDASANATMDHKEEHDDEDEDHRSPFLADPRHLVRDLLAFISMAWR